MSVDIGRQLRRYARAILPGDTATGHLTWQAADEIERLQGELNQVLEILGDRENEIGLLRAALEDMIEISQRNSEATLMLIAIRRCAEHALDAKARRALEQK